MNAKQLMKALVVATGLGAIGMAHAGVYNFTGTLNYHNDIVQFGFSLATAATNVRVWTDSFDNGANFDPITALWTASGTRLAQNDDNPTVNPATQTFWDSGFTLAALDAGDYIFTITPYANFANGSTLAQGFSYDAQTPIPIEQWWMNAPGYWSVWFDGVDSVTPPSVPEPATLSLLGLGLAGLGVLRRRQAG